MPWPRKMGSLDRAKWERMRARGRRHYILVYGVLVWGLGTGLLGSALHWIEGWPSFHFWPDFFVNLIVFALAGMLFGYWTWRVNESLYWGDVRR